MPPSESRRKPRWDGDELELLRRLAIGGASGPEIANRLGRSTGAIQQKALQLGIALVRVDRTAWWQGRQSAPEKDEASGRPPSGTASSETGR